MGDSASAFFERLALLKAHQSSDVHGVGLTRAATGLMSRAPPPPPPQDSGLRPLSLSTEPALGGPGGHSTALPFSWM